MNTDTPPKAPAVAETAIWSIELRRKLADGRWHSMGAASNQPSGGYDTEEGAQNECNRLNEDRWPGFSKRLSCDIEGAYLPTKTE